MDYYLKSTDEVLKNFNTAEAGLSREEAAKRLAENGRNELEKAKKKSLISRVAEQIINPMVLILLAAAAVSIGLTIFEGSGLHGFAEAGVILVVVILNSILGVFQESKAEKAIEALQEMSAATAKVRRTAPLPRSPRRSL